MDGEKNEYVVENFIGSGAFGNVFKAKKIWMIVYGQFK